MGSARFVAAGAAGGGVAAAAPTACFVDVFTACVAAMSADDQTCCWGVGCDGRMSWDVSLMLPAAGVATMPVLLGCPCHP